MNRQTCVQMQQQKFDTKLYGLQHFYYVSRFLLFTFEMK